MALSSGGGKAEGLLHEIECRSSLQIQGRGEGQAGEALGLRLKLRGHQEHCSSNIPGS